MLGIDMVSIDRLEKSILKFGDKMKNRFMTSNEQKWAKRIYSMAGIWAAKEAFSKAIGTGIGAEFSFNDIEIMKNPKGKPIIHILSPALKLKLHDAKIDVSITHDSSFAIASVIIIEHNHD